MINQGRRPLIDFNLYLVTDRQGCAGRPLLFVVEEALKGGVKAVQLREKDLSGRELYELGMAMRSLTARYGARLFINDRIDVALAVNADGVHLGEKSVTADIARKVIGAEKLIGVSCHGHEGAIAAQKRVADFITCGPVYQTPSKAVYGPPLGVATLHEVTDLVRLPVFAIGGINNSNTHEVISAGAHGVALISAILAADDPRKEAADLLALLNTVRKQEQ